MLTELSIRNLAVIERVHLQFGTGFHVLTGETGAGKSIIIDALTLIVGGRGSADLVRHGSEKAEIEAQFDVAHDHPVWEKLGECGIEANKEEQIIIRREITVQGKSSSRVNGQLVNLTMLREIGETLVNIHGQHEHQSLLKSEEHIQWLDLYGEGEIGQSKQRYQAAFDRYAKLEKELRELQEGSKHALQMLDMYRYQIDEIASAKLRIDEDVSLAEEKRKLANAEKLFQNASDGYDFLYGSNRALDAAGKAIQRIQEIAQLDPALGPLLEQANSAFYQLEDVAYQLRDYRDSVEFNPARLDQIEHRLDLISGLRRKYGSSVTEILEHMASIQKELDTIVNKDELIEKLQHQLDAEQANLSAAAEQLSQARINAAKQLSAEIEHELQDLHMDKTKFQVSIEQADAASGGLPFRQRHVKFNRSGADQIEFLISPNPGEPLRGLSKIASGGELSRIMLAMKTIFARVDRIPVLIFDEVDTGVSGRAAQAIAEKCARLASDCQVFSITHLPQVACMADRHYAVQKEVESGRTHTKVAHLQGNSQIEELARMLGGAEITDTTMNHAREMIKLASEKKSAYKT